MTQRKYYKVTRKDPRIKFEEQKEIYYQELENKVKNNKVIIAVNSFIVWTFRWVAFMFIFTSILMIIWAIFSPHPQDLMMVK